MLNLSIRLLYTFCTKGAKTKVSYMRNFCKLIGLEQWIPACENYKTFVGSSINK